MEMWKPIAFAEGYEVSNEGWVRSWRRRGGALGVFAKSPRLLRLKLDRYGYRIACLSIGCKMRHISVSRLVALAFIGEQPEGKPFVLHGDGNPLNNTPENLRWGTPAENNADMIRHGRSLRGERNHQAKLASEQVPEVFRLRRLGLSQREIGERLGVCQSHVSRILLGKKWRHHASQKAGA